MKRLVMLALVLAVTGCNRSTDAATNDAPAGMADPIPFTDAQKAAIQATFPAPYNTADLAAGEKQFGKCRSCHMLAPGAMDMTGPNLYGVFGRKSGTKPGYAYSDAMTAHNTVWDFDSLNTYLASPQTVVKGTKMGFMGIQGDTDRRNLIAYLKLENSPLPAAESASDEASDSASSH